MLYARKRPPKDFPIPMHPKQIIDPSSNTHSNLYRLKKGFFAALCSSFILVSGAFDLRAVSETIYKAYHSSNFQKRPVGCIELGKAAVGGNLWQRFLEDRLFAQSGEPV